MCLDKSKWTGSKTFSDSATGWGSGSCDSYIQVPTDSDTGVKVFNNFGFGAGKKRWADVSSCSNFTESQKNVIKMKGFTTECCDGKTILDSCKSSTDLSKSGTGRSTISAATIAAVVYIAHLLGN